MWAVDDPDRYARALRGAHTATTRLEVWSQGQPVDEAPFEDWTVTDTWVTAGVRRSLSLSVEPTRAWLKFLELPSMEVRPFRGVRLNRSTVMESPCGVFPVLTADRALPVSKLGISADDRFGQVIRASFATPVQTTDRPMGDVLTWFLNGAGLHAKVTTSAAGQMVPGALFDKGNGSRAKAIGDYAKSLAIEVWVDRVGDATIADGAALVIPGDSDMSGTVKSMSSKSDPSKVFNQVSVSSSAQGVNFDPQVAVITNPSHPAYPSNIGGNSVLFYSSPLILTPADAMASAKSILAKASGQALTYSYSCVCDARRDAGDSITAPLVTGTTGTFQIATVTVPAKGDQTITTVSTQQDYP